MVPVKIMNTSSFIKPIELIPSRKVADFTPIVRSKITMREIFTGTVSILHAARHEGQARDNEPEREKLME